MKPFSAILSLSLVVMLLSAFTSLALSETPELHFLYLNDGGSTRCDSVWRGVGGYIWCTRSGGIQGRPEDEVDMTRTFQVQAAANQLIDRSLDEFQKQNWDNVITVTSAAISLEPKNEVAYTNRSGAYAYRGMHEEAIEDCNRAIAINPYFGLAYNNRGYAFECTGRIKQAVSDYEMSCRLGDSLGCSNYERLKMGLQLTGR